MARMASRFLRKPQTILGRRVVLADRILGEIAIQLRLQDGPIARQLMHIHESNPNAINHAFQTVATSSKWSSTQTHTARRNVRAALRVISPELYGALPSKLRETPNRDPADRTNVAADACVPSSIRQLGNTHWLYTLFANIHHKLLTDKCVRSQSTASQYLAWALRFLSALLTPTQGTTGIINITQDIFYSCVKRVTLRDAEDAFVRFMQSQPHTSAEGRPICNTTNISVLRTRKSVCNVVCALLLTPAVPRPALGKHVANDMLRATLASPTTNKFLRASHQVHPFLTEDEETAVRNACTTPLEHLIINVLFTTGMRISAFCGIRLDGIIKGWDPSDVTTTDVMSLPVDAILQSGVTVEKNNTVFPFIIFPAVQRSIWNWLTSEQRSAFPIGPFLINSPRVPHAQCSKNFVCAVFRRVCRSALPPERGNVTPHIARHTVAERLYKAGNPVSAIAQYLRHSEDICSSVYLRRNISSTVESMTFPWNVKK